MMSKSAPRSLDPDQLAVRVMVPASSHVEGAGSLAIVYYFVPREEAEGR
jgi:hypothetical protein